MGLLWEVRDTVTSLIRKNTVLVFLPSMRDTLIGKWTDSDSVDLGSNPSPATNKKGGDVCHALDR